MGPDDQNKKWSPNNDIVVIVHCDITIGIYYDIINPCQTMHFMKKAVIWNILLAVIRLLLTLTTLQVDYVVTINIGAYNYNVHRTLVEHLDHTVKLCKQHTQIL